MMYAEVGLFNNNIVPNTIFKHSILSIFRIYTVFKKYDDLGLFWCRMMTVLFFDDDLDNIYVEIRRK